MGLKRIHVNQHIIRENNGRTEKLPVFTVKEGSKNTYGMRVKMLGPSELVYQPDDPLSCGAKAWIETEGDVEIIGSMTWDQIQALK